MELVNQLIGFIKNLFDWWFVVMPWEQAIFVKRGKSSELLTAGLYFKIPFVDFVFIQTCRMRMIDCAVQTVSTKDSKTITIKSCIGYSIGDMKVLYNKMAHPEITLSSMSMSYVAEYIRNATIEEATPEKVEKFVNEKLNAESFGLKDVMVKITSWADVKTFRLIQDNSWVAETLNMEAKK